ncbi:hypothetical protein F7725_013432 [Dissostichus mawsoni]|uniref:Uncharacterized protein n=1 Tax=Dissostichus mawsoni TaxID=36200 RepID=A0A7J5YQH9_DISMA|nr:hypothetical protein F7725_013432 [Dissostichus mawsoni]
MFTPCTMCFAGKSFPFNLCSTRTVLVQYVEEVLLFPIILCNDRAESATQHDEEVGLRYGEEGAVSVSSDGEDEGLPREDGQVTHHLSRLDDMEQILFGSLENGVNFVVLDIFCSSFTVVVNS